MPQSNTAQLEARLVELETRVAFQDELLTALNSSTVELGDEMGRLRRLCNELRSSLETIRVAMAHDPNDEPPPPHY